LRHKINTLFESFLHIFLFFHFHFIIFAPMETTYVSFEPIKQTTKKKKKNLWTLPIAIAFTLLGVVAVYSTFKPIKMKPDKESSVGMRSSFLSSAQNMFTSVSRRMKVQPFIGTWTCDKSKDVRFVDFLKQLGVGMVQRNLMAMSEPTLVISAQGKQIGVLNTDSGNFYHMNLDGSPFEFKLSPDEHGVATLHFEGQSMVTSGTLDNGIKVVIQRTPGPRSFTQHITAQLPDGELTSHSRTFIHKTSYTQNAPLPSDSEGLSAADQNLVRDH